MFESEILRDEHDGREGDSEAGKDDVEPEGTCHLGTGGNYLAGGCRQRKLENVHQSVRSVADGRQLG